MVMRRAQDLEVQQALHLVVVEILGGTGDMAKHVLALRAFSDLPEIVVALVGEELLAEFEHGVSPMRAWRPAARRRTGRR